MLWQLRFVYTNLGQVARDDANLSKGYGFISFSNFEASDEAIANMNGQYLMNKEISVQYAYKKDGKGERHGDQAERMLAAQARKHNVQPTAQPLPAGLFSGGVPSTPTSMLDGDAGRSLGAGGFGRPGMQNGGYQNGAAPPQRPPPPSQPLPAPPSGLPARPPPSQAGYGGPQGFLPPGFNPPQQQNYPPPGAPPPGFAPPGFGPPTGGAPPGMPPGFQQPGYGRAR